MKKLNIACLVLSIYSTAVAQSRAESKEVVTTKTKIAIKGGVNMSTARVYQNDVKLDTKSITGYGIGFLFNIPFEGKLHFSPSLAYNKRGYIYTPKSGTITEYQNSIHYFDIVPNLSLYIPVGKNFIAISAGPHLSVALAGNEKTSTSTGSSSSKMIFSLSGNYGFIDLGTGAALGFHTKKIVVEAAFQLGLANINNNVEADFRNIRNRMLSLQVGYYLK